MILNLRNILESFVDSSGKFLFSFSIKAYAYCRAFHETNQTLIWVDLNSNKLRDRLLGQTSKLGRVEPIN